MALIVVTGGAGFIGSHLVERLVRDGETVRVLEHPRANADHLPPEVELVRTDITERAAVYRALAGARHVYHLAANPNLWARDPQEFEAVNHRGAVNVLDAALAAGAQRVLHTSTESILMRAKSRRPVTEDVEVTTEDAVGPYCRSKLAAEQYAASLARAGKPVIIASPTLPVGPGDRGLSPPTRLIRDFCRGHIPARTECTLNLIDVRDVAEGLIRALHLGRPGRRYLLGGENLSLLEVMVQLSALSGAPVPRLCVPHSVSLGVAAILEAWASHVSHAHPRATVTGVHLARRSSGFDASRSLAELGLQPRPVKESLAAAVDWLRRERQVPPYPGPRLGSAEKVSASEFVVASSPSDPRE